MLISFIIFFFFLIIRRQPISTLFPYTTLFRSDFEVVGELMTEHYAQFAKDEEDRDLDDTDPNDKEDRKSTRLNSSHSQISYAVFCLKKKKKITAYNINKIRKTDHIDTTSKLFK